jgi:hypothetical protein
VDDNERLINQLQAAGISRAAIEAAWPSWWNAEAAQSPSGRAELRFALARRLGLEARPLLGERVKFIWNDEARFKSLSTGLPTEKAALTSFGVSIARLLLRATPVHRNIIGIDATTLRSSILSANEYVDLQSLLSTCWAFGVPAIHLRVFPLDTKNMHAMVIEHRGRYAILLGRDSSYPAPVAFTLAHELGHIVLNHIEGAPAIVDFDDPIRSRNSDRQEVEADSFALSILTGSPRPNIETSLRSFNAPTLASSVLRAGPTYRIEPGTLALCIAYTQNCWAVSMASLRFIYKTKKPVWREVNSIADTELDWSQISPDSAQYLRIVMGADV